MRATLGCCATCNRTAGESDRALYYKFTVEHLVQPRICHEADHNAPLQLAYCDGCSRYPSLVLRPDQHTQGMSSQRHPHRHCRPRQRTSRQPLTANSSHDSTQQCTVTVQSLSLLFYCSPRGGSFIAQGAPAHSPRLDVSAPRQRPVETSGSSP